MGEIASYHKKDQLSPSLCALQVVNLWPFFGLPLFVSLAMVLAVILFFLNKIK
jgi:hypothetical protein